MYAFYQEETLLRFCCDFIVLLSLNQNRIDLIVNCLKFSTCILFIVGDYSESALLINVLICFIVINKYILFYTFL